MYSSLPKSTAGQNYNTSPVSPARAIRDHSPQSSPNYNSSNLHGSYLLQKSENVAGSANHLKRIQVARRGREEQSKIYNGNYALKKQKKQCPVTDNSYTKKIINISEETEVACAEVSTMTFGDASLYMHQMIHEMRFDD